MGVSKNRGIPKWLVYFMENPFKMDDLAGFPIIFGLTPIQVRWFRQICEGWMLLTLVSCYVVFSATTEFCPPERMLSYMAWAR